MADKEPKQKPLASSDKTSEPPASSGGKAFKKLIGEFSHGVKALNELVNKKTFPGQSYDGKISPIKDPTQGKIIQALYHPQMMSTSAEAPGRPGNGHSVEQASKKMELSSLASVGASPVVGGADKEAMRQIMGQDGAEPAPVRLSRILKAEKTAIENGAVPPEIAHLANAVKEGRLRDVADISPSQIDTYINKHRSNPTLTPSEGLDNQTTNSIVANHENTINLVRHSILEQARRSGVAIDIPNGNEHSYSGPNVPKLLSQMAATNDIPHLHSAQQRIRNHIVQQQAQQQDRVHQTTKALSLDAGGTESVKFQRQMEESNGYVANGVNNGARSAGNPLNHEETKLPKKQGSGDSSRKTGPKSMNLTGSATIKGANGMPTGHIVFDGE